MWPFSRKLKPKPYDYVEHMKALLVIIEKAIKITESVKENLATHAKGEDGL